MPITPGLAAIPTVVVNTALSLLPDTSYAVCAPDSLAVVSPMYNEARGAEGALASLLEQSDCPEHIAISVNGGDDDTYGVVTRLLARWGYRQFDVQRLEALQATCESWLSDHPSRVTVLSYDAQTSKSQSVNNLVLHGVVTADRVLVVDGDTRFHPDFVRELRRNFYRLHLRAVDGRREAVLEDYALQSGAVTSFAPPGSSARQIFISRGREAEYAFAGVLRTGQARQVGRGDLWGKSRLYTVIGCGFAARRELFPMPVDTETEDHDFTLVAQNQVETRFKLSPSELEARGFRFVVDGLLKRPLEVFDQGERILLKRSGNARFVERALMATEDPPHFNGFVRQVERWNGGGQQAVLKRLGAALEPNLRFTVWMSLFENLLGLLVLALIPLLLALHHGNPSLGLTWLMLAAWLGVDALVTGTLVGYGFYRQRRALGQRPLAALLRAASRSLVTTLPFLVLRFINPVTYLASATRVVPEHLRRRRSPSAATGVVWERSHARRRTRSGGVFGWTALGMTACALGAANVAPYLNPVNASAWHILSSASQVDMAQHEGVPLMVTASASALPIPIEDVPGPAALRSAFCAPERVPGAAAAPRLLRSDPAGYLPLNRWGLLTLARLAPLLPYLEGAATAYDVPPGIYVQILLNESYLDPLAIGPSEDKGLSQVTSDALTLLKALSQDPGSPYYNPDLFASSFSVFDPDFSLCAGAAKLAWAYDQPGVTDDQQAYALYINPVHGFANGRISRLHIPLTEAMLSLEPMVKALGGVLAAYDADPGRVSASERRLLDAAAALERGELSLEAAYRVSYEVVREDALHDESMYLNLFSSYFGVPGLAAAAP